MKFNTNDTIRKLAIFQLGKLFAIVTNGHGDFVTELLPTRLMKYEQSRPKL